MSAMPKLNAKEICFFAASLKETEKEETRTEDDGKEDPSIDVDDPLIHTGRNSNVTTAMAILTIWPAKNPTVMCHPLNLFRGALSSLASLMR
jgi:hypothetical protein